MRPCGLGNNSHNRGATLFYRIANANPLGTETGAEWEGLFTAQEVEQIRERYYEHDRLTDVLIARLACNDCDDCDLSDHCNR